MEIVVGFLLRLCVSLKGHRDLFGGCSALNLMPIICAE
jgi:hypothetical protein